MIRARGVPWRQAAAGQKTHRLSKNTELLGANIAVAAILRCQGKCNRAKVTLNQILSDRRSTGQTNAVESIVYLQLAMIYEQREQYDPATALAKFCHFLCVIDFDSALQITQYGIRKR